MIKEKKTTEVEWFAQFLKKRRCFFTTQRKLIVHHVLTIQNHFDAKDLTGLFKIKNIRISRATIYRTLSQLEICGLIKKMGMRNGFSYYEQVLGTKRHEHICCEKCGKIIEFSDPILEKRIEEILKNNNFTTANNTVQIFSSCKKCNT